MDNHLVSPVAITLRPLPVRYSYSGGFTLVEIIIVVLMIAVLSSIAVFSFAGLGDEESIKSPSNELIRLSKTAVRAAAIQGRPFTIAFEKEGFSLLGWEGKGGNHVPLPEGTKLSILRWGEKEWHPAVGQTWMFGSNGLCDPIKVRFESNNSMIEMGFNPLTGSPVDQVTQMRK